MTLAGQGSDEGVCGVATYVEFEESGIWSEKIRRCCYALLLPSDRAVGGLEPISETPQVAPPGL